MSLYILDVSITIGGTSKFMKKVLFLISCVSFLVLIGCSSSKTISGDKMFPSGYFDDITSLRYYASDETVFQIDNPQELNHIWDAFRDNTYTEYEKEQLIGGYDIRLVSDEREIEIVLDNSHFLIDGKWYYSEKPLADIIMQYINN